MQKGESGRRRVDEDGKIVNNHICDYGVYIPSEAFIEKEQRSWKDKNIHTYFPFLVPLHTCTRRGLYLPQQVCCIWARTDGLE